MKKLFLLLFLIPIFVQAEVNLLCSGHMHSSGKDMDSSRHFQEYFISFDEQEKSFMADERLTCRGYGNPKIVGEFIEINKKTIKFFHRAEENGKETCTAKVSINRLSGKLDFIMTYGGYLFWEQGELFDCNVAENAKF